MIGVLLMAYGSPERPEDVAAYFTHIRGGRPPSREAIERLQHRYAVVGGRTPLLDITLEVRNALDAQLNAESSSTDRYQVFVGMKHWHPYIGDVVPRMASDGVTEIVAVALAPHYSRMSIGGYRKAVEDANRGLSTPLAVRFVDEWHTHPLFIDLIAGRIREGLLRWPAKERGQVVTVFSAHSLPSRIREWDDPYERQLLESCRLAADRAGLDHWQFAWQSAGETGEPWLGPDIGEVLGELARGGVRHVLSVPIGFVSDHLEILYDIDLVARRQATALGVTLHRTRMPNADPALVDVLGSVVAGALACAS